MDETSDELIRLASLAEPARRELYLFVERNGEPVSRDQAASALGMARPVAAFHLDKLVEAGLLRVEYRRLSGRRGPGAGRPSKLYSPFGTVIEVTIPPRRYELVAGLLADALERTEDDATERTGLQRAAEEHGRALARRARTVVDRPPPSAQLEESVVRTLDAIGYRPRQRGREITFENCPFHELARAHPGTICAVNSALVRGVVDGVGVHASTERVLPPNPCCVRVTLESTATRQRPR